MNNNKIAWIATFLLFASAPAMPEGFSVILNGKSFHVDADEDWNEDNYGLGIEYQFPTQSRWKTRLMANGFRDSNEDMSYMVGGGLHRNLWSTSQFADLYLDVGINAFLMTRHDVNDNNPFPGALPSMTVGNRYLGLNLTYLPKQALERMTDARMMDKSISGIFFLQLKLNMAAVGAGH